MRAFVLGLLFLLCSMPVAAQQVTGLELAIGAAPTSPSGSSVRITGLGGSGGDGVLFTNASGDMIKRVLAKADLPAVTVFTDQANTFGAFLQTFGSAGLTSNGNVTITGTNDLITGSGGIRTSTGAVEIRNIADTLIIGSFGDAAIALNQPTTLTGLTTFVGAIRGSASPLIIRNAGNTLDIVSIADLGTSITGTLGIGGLTTATGGLKATKIFGTSNPLLFRNAADTATIITMADNAVTIAEATTVQANVTITSTFDLITGTGGIRTSTGTVDIRNIADTATTASFGDAAITFNQPLTVNAALNVTGLSTLAAVKATSYRAVTSPFTIVAAADGVTQLMTMTDAGLNRVTNSGLETVWEYYAGQNPSGQRLWRAGNIGGSFLIQGGNDAGSLWTNIFRTTQTGGVPDGWFWGVGVKDVNPDQNDQTNLGAINKRYANLHVSNLWAGTLVAYDTITTIPGNVLVGPTTTLEADIAAAATSMTVEHNEMVANDIVFMQKSLATEYIQVTSGASGTSAVSYVGGNQSQLTTVTIPAHQVGDLIIIYAFASTAVTPTMGMAGGTSVCNGSGGATGYRIGAKIAASTGETSGTWTSATHMQSRVYRASANSMIIPSTCAASANAGSTTTLTYPALTALNTSQGSWIGRAGYSTTATNVEQVPAGFTLRAANGGGPEMATFDTNGGVASVASAAITLNTLGAVRALTVEISAPTLGPYNYSISRAYGGVFAARDWASGDAIFNTGQFLAGVGDCHLQMYAIQSIKGTGEAGPTVQGNCRTSNVYNGWSTNWALGNLRGHFNYGASDVFGAAFGDPADVWLGIDATNGIRFFEGATNQRMHIALDGSILIGSAAAGQFNTYIDNTQILHRAGTVQRLVTNASGIYLNTPDGLNTKVQIDATGVLVGQTGAGQANTYITNTAFNLRQATTNRVVLDSTSLRFYDTGGVNYPMEFGTAFTRFGYGHASTFSHIYADNVGNLSFGTTAVTRMHLAASNGALTFRDTSGTTRVTLDSSGALFGITNAGNANILLDTSGNANFRSGTVTRLKIDAGNALLSINDTAGTARVTLGSGAIQMYDQSGVRGVYLDSASGLVLGGDTLVAGKPYMQITATELRFATSAAVSKLVFNGTSGDITSTGDFVLSTGGNITSTGNFSLTAAIGLRFEPNTASTLYSAPKAIAWGSSATGAAIWSTVSAGNNRVNISTDRSSERGLVVFNVGTATYLGLNGPTGGAVHIVRGVSGSGTIGDSTNPFTVYGSTYYSSGTAGFTGACSAASFTVTGGIITAC